MPNRNCLTHLVKQSACKELTDGQKKEGKSFVDLPSLSEIGSVEPVPVIGMESPDRG
jgi:hypothetical protein